MSFWRSRRGGFVLLVLVVGAGIYVYTSRANRDINGAIQREGQGYFEPYVGRDYENSGLEVTTLRPTYESWHNSGDREVVCVLYHVDAEPLNGTAKGSRL
jgi:hypothetical protein